MAVGRRCGGGLGVLLLVLLAARTVDAESPLVAAIQAGDASRVRSLLHDRAEVNAAEADGTTPLHWAVRRHQVAIADLLIRAGADVQAANRYGVTPLAAASADGQGDLIQRLLEAGANPNTPNPEGETPLMLAARSGGSPGVKALLARGADARASERWRGQDALMWASAEGHADVVRLLIDAGADVQKRSTCAGATSTWLACCSTPVPTRTTRRATGPPRSCWQRSTAAFEPRRCCSSAVRIRMRQMCAGPRFTRSRGCGRQGGRSVSPRFC
jgi:ankyrin repeat protein